MRFGILLSSCLACFVLIADAKASFARQQDVATVTFSDHQSRSEFPVADSFEMSHEYWGGTSDSFANTKPWGIRFSDVLQFNTGSDALQGAAIDPDARRSWTLIGGFGYETFRGVNDLGWQNNGLYGNLNLGSSLGEFSEVTGVGVQAGFSRGLYDWEGSPYRTDYDSRMSQDFVTYGFFKRATSLNPCTFAVTQDWMFGRTLAVKASIQI